MKSPLRVGLLLDSLIQPAWIHKIVTDVQQSAVADVVLVVLNEPQDGQNGDGRSPSMLQKLRRHQQDLLYILYRKLDTALFPAQPDAFAPVDLSPTLGDCPVLKVTPRQTKFSDYLEEADAAAIGDYELDVALRFGFRILRGDFLAIARYGVWSYHHGDNLVNRGGPAGFWEVMEGHATTGSVLQILSERLDDGKVIYRSQSATQRHSVNRSKNNYYWKSTAFVRRKLQQLYHEGPCALDCDTGKRLYQPYSQRLYVQPGNGEMARLLWRWGKRYLRARLIHSLFRHQWFLAYQIGRPSHDSAPALYRFKSIVPPKDRFWADPFPLKRDGRFYLFIEEFLYQANRGHIAVIEMDEKGNWQTPKPVLERPYHLSYPFIFHWQGEDYMIPETADNQTIELYRCVSFPDEWALQQVLMQDVNAVDTTLVEIDGRWWMFVNLAVDGAARDDELHLFYADSPLGPWQPHKQNPVRSDVRGARPAGRPFCWRGRWYRPGQDGSETYGYAVVLHRILQLDKDDYVEEAVSAILPNWRDDLLATHTFNQAEELIVVDGMARRPRFW